MSKANKTKNDSKNTLTIKTKEQDREKALAEIALNGAFNSALISQTFSKEIGGEQLDITASFKNYQAKAESLQGPNGLKDIETMLLSQAVALDTLFGFLTLRSGKNMGEYMDAAERYMKLALKAQSQCRATCETLAFVKNPQPYVKNMTQQMNVAQNQQINNGPQPHAGAGKLKQSNELLEDNRHETQWMDAGKTEKAGGNDKELEAVEVEYRAENRKR